MRHQADARIIKVNKANLIAKILENKNKHQAEYADAVKAYRIEAQEQIDAQQKKLNEGEFGIQIYLVTPVDKSEEYDKIVTMFQWELSDEVELSQGEFNEYIFDETSFAIQSRASNSTYLHKSKGLGK